LKLAEENIFINVGGTYFFEIDLFGEIPLLYRAIKGNNKIARLSHTILYKFEKEVIRVCSSQISKFDSL